MSVANAKLRFINDETRATYDAGDPAPASPPRGHITVITDDARDRAIACGLVAAGMYLYLEGRADRDGRCWPSYSTIADDTGLSRRQTIRVITKLIDAGLVEIHKRTDPNGADLTNVFYLPFHPHQIGSDTNVTPPVTSMSPVTPMSPKVLPEIYRSRSSQSKDVPPVKPVNQLTGSTDTGQAPAKKKRSISPLTRTQLARFERWYEHYPLKEARAAAERAWAKVDPDDEQVTAMIETLTWQIPEKNWTRANRKFIPHPATYLNAGRWRDEPATSIADETSPDPTFEAQAKKLLEEARALSQQPSNPNHPGRAR